MNPFNDLPVMTPFDWLALAFVCLVAIGFLARLFWLWITPPAMRGELCHVCSQKAGDTKWAWRLSCKTESFRCAKCGGTAGVYRGNAIVLLITMIGLTGCATTRNLPPLPTPTAPPIKRMTSARANTFDSDQVVTGPQSENIVVNWGDPVGITGRNTFTWALPLETRYVRIQCWTNGVAAPEYIHDTLVYGPAVFIKPGYENESVIWKSSSMVEVVQ